MLVSRAMPTPTPGENQELAMSPPASGADWLRLLRPRQWIKNGVVFAGLLFTGKFHQFDALVTSSLVFVAFCLLSSAGYIINDLCDRRRDRLHPRKCTRPLASGAIKPAQALILSLLLLALGFGLSFTGGWITLVISVAYALLTTLYSFIGKHVVLVDLMSISAGFLLRALAGTACLHVPLSAWLFICITFLTLMLGFGKRRQEIANFQEDAARHRPILAHYSLAFIDQAIGMLASASIITYAIYSISSPTAQAHAGLVYTMLPVLYAVLRYLYLTLHAAQGDQPEEIFLLDRPMLTAVFLWFLSILTVFQVG